jgi:hypothetical protein
LGRDEVGVLVEEHNFVAIGYRSFAVASLALEAMGDQEPTSFFDCRVAAAFTFKSEVDMP